MDRQVFGKIAQSTVVPVVVFTPGGVHQVGTAFCVSPTGVWITARHVLEGRLGALEYCAKNPHSSQIAILYIGLDDDCRIPIPVTSFTRHPASGSDLAVLWTDTPSINFPTLRLSALVPPEGTSIIALGYPEFETKIFGTDATQFYPNLEITVGKVTHVYLDGRDKNRDLDGNLTGDLTTACYQTTARVDGAMSGGPVLDPSGSVCGVNAKGFNRVVPNEPDTSYISATPHIFMLKVCYDADNQVSIYELARRGIVLTDKSFERLRMTEGDGQIWVYYGDEG